MGIIVYQSDAQLCIFLIWSKIARFSHINNFPIICCDILLGRPFYPTRISRCGHSHCGVDCVLLPHNVTCIYLLVPLVFLSPTKHYYM